MKTVFNNTKTILICQALLEIIKYRVENNFNQVTTAWQAP